MDNKQLDYDDFLEKYTCVENPFTEGGSFNNCMFETYGEEYQLVIKQVGLYPASVWTVIDCDGWYGITAGYHWINRIGYLITEQEWETDDEEFTICDEGPVNDWFNDLEVEEQKKVFAGINLRTTNELTVGDQLSDAWYDLCVDEKEELMEKYKNQNNGL